MGSLASINMQTQTLHKELKLETQQTQFYTQTMNTQVMSIECEFIMQWYKSKQKQKQCVEIVGT
jgi:hypothetical protein